MTQSDGFVMVRRPGCIPFVAFEGEWASWPKWEPKKQECAVAGYSKKQDWAEEMADRLVARIDHLARAHATNDELLAGEERSRLRFELKELIFALDTRTHVATD